MLLRGDVHNPQELQRRFGLTVPDPVKKKYFRIQADNVAPAGSQYSASAVKKRKVETEARYKDQVFRSHI